MRRTGRWYVRLLKTAVVLLTGFLLLFDFRWRPILLSSAKSQAKVMIIRQINEQIDGVLKDMAEEDVAFVSMTSDASGSVRSLSLNSVAVDRLKCEFLDRYDASSDGILTFRTTLGTLSGLSMFNGLGPYLTFSAELAHAPNVEILSTFEEAGINQTLHRVVFRVLVKAGYLYPGGECSETISTDYLISETVLLGDVPSTYGSLLLSGKVEVP